MIDIDEKVIKDFFHFYFRFSLVQYEQAEQSNVKMLSS